MVVTNNGGGGVWHGALYRIIEVGLEAPIQRAQKGRRVVATPFILILVNPMSSLINIQKATNDVNTLPLQSDVIPSARVRDD